MTILQEPRRLQRIATTYSQRARLDAWRTRGARPAPVSFGLRLRGPVSHELLEQVLTALAARHTAMRTAFAPDAVCLPPGEVRWDLRRFRPGERPAAYDWLHEPFDLTAPPLFRGVHLRSGEVSEIGLAVDHIVMDGGSVRVFLLDFQRIYRWAVGVTAAIGEGASDMGEFARAERDWCRERGAESVRFWSGRWRDFGPFPPLRMDPPAGAGAGAGVWRDTVAVHGHGLNVGRVTTPVLTAAAALAAIRDVTGATEAGVILPSARRFLPGLDQTIGYLTNRVLLRLDTPAGQPFEDLVRAVRAYTISALEQTMMPFELLTAELAPGSDPRRPGHPYLHLNVMRPPAAPSLPGLEVACFEPPRHDADAHLSGMHVDLADTAGPVLSATYANAVFDPAFVARLMERMSGYLQGTTG
ncbi:condensation domain-containing protein [Paractinoplanes rishiriensis]|uniref:Condensation domain-containing protein n=1 Tax=Paractinoplanes rishiriensis TaxID=1050105 RepID=A0A919JVB9_9ACTN|nr:condensation domain-containing protein [Actinoplanes rishiriensis]GIE94285.1 hypothetical protein Ari01nite_17500 [Actinoplanes rishiriensis]